MRPFRFLAEAGSIADGKKFRMIRDRPGISSHGRPHR